MARRDESHAGAPRRPRFRILPVVVVALVLAAAVGSFRFDLGSRWLGWDYPSPRDEPAAVAPPPGLDVPEMEPAEPVAAALAPEAVDPDAVRRALAPLVGDRDLGRRFAVAVAGLDGEIVHRDGVGAVIPASTMKLLTTTAALASVGSDHRFRTTVMSVPRSRRVVLVGGGDPFLASAPASSDVYPARADVRTLARATAQALRDEGRTRVRVSYDASLFADDPVNETWEPSYVPDGVVSPITALWVDEGVNASGFRVPDPAQAAAETFVAQLRASGIEVPGTPDERATPAAATELAAVSSAPLGAIVERVLDVSDNEAAEVLARHVAVAADADVTFAGASASVAAVLGELGIDTSGDRIRDGSGLSRENFLSVDTLVGTLAAAAAEDHPDLREVTTGLPVAGFTGSLAFRFTTGPDAGPGNVRAKTGTLTGVHGLAGVAVGTDGVPMIFVAIADRVRVADTLDARALIDRMAAELAACACAEPSGETP